MIGWLYLLLGLRLVGGTGDGIAWNGGERGTGGRPEGELKGDRRETGGELEGGLEGN